MPRTLGLDVGSRRIGVAITDELLAFAHPVTVLDRRGTSRDVEQIRALCEHHGADLVVFGIPFEPDGTEGHRASRVRVLLDALRDSGVRVDEVDESFSTVEAHDVMIEADLSRHKRKAQIDRAAAAVILQRWIERGIDERERNSPTSPMNAGPPR